ncbi:hypothetical protein I5438_01710 [Citrobacter freundii]|uniref:hypothetical protein n=1 Tax=Citrobacter freundii TaxID=546 RepID=UPI001900E5EB|nr:hypothetical protein [Citrobacter freundii]MBJ8975305.1 hypothetical protein [Citrobacter freundii]MBJ9012035.1 hypothetical protein [Citrobacter freundii]
MARVLNVINILLLSIVGMLFLTGVMVLVQGSKVDLGKAADWWAALSAVATVGTFTVALIALKKAPDWFKQKIVEDGYSLANEIIYVEMPELHVLSNKFRVKLTAYCLNLHLNINKEIINGDYTKTLAVDVDNLISELTFASFKLQKKISSLKRYEWVANDELIKKIKTISQIISEFNDLKSEAEIDFEKVFNSITTNKKDDLSTKDIEKFDITMQAMISRCRKLHRNISSHILSITDLNLPVTHFFIIPK